MSETIKNIDSPKSLDPMTCELAIDLHEKLRHTRFISTKELKKLNTCYNIKKLHRYFEIENNILDILFTKDINLKNQTTSKIFIEIDNRNEVILDLIQEYVSIDYIRHSTTDFKDENIL